jgi:hypothetical protein
VVSICRKVWKLPASVAPEVELRELFEELDEGRGVVPETGVATLVVVVISVSSYSDVYAAI